MLPQLLVAAVLSMVPAQSGLDIELRGTDTAKPVVVLTNTSDTPCQIVAGSGLGTVAFTRVDQEGKAIVPLPLEVSFYEDMELLLTQRLKTLEPGKSAEIPLPVVKGGPIGTALEMVTWSPNAGTFAALYPIATGKPLNVEVTYSVPVKGDGKTKICAAAHSVGSDVNDKRPQWILWAAAAGGGLVLLVLLIVLLLVWRKKRAAAIAVILLVAVLGFSARERPASATVTNVDPSTQAAFDNCISVFHQSGNDPAGILPALEAAGVNVTVQRPVAPGDSHEAALDGNTIFVFWDPDDTHRYFGGGGNADPCSTLYHELHHGWQHNQGSYSQEPCATSDRRGRTLSRTEVEATRAQNLLRERLGLPQRDHYGDIPLPSGECRPPEPPDRCTGASCGDSNGDPHLLTFDNKRYDFQAVGEFVLVKETSGNFQVQVRQQPASTNRVVSLNTAVAMQVGSEKVEVRMTADGPVLLVGGTVQQLANTRLADGDIKVAGDDLTVSWENNGPKVFVRTIGRWGLRLSVQPAPAQAGKLQGLLGDYDGDSKNDIKPLGGSPIAEPTFAALYPSYADSWRIDGKSSLFTYEAGTNTQTFTDRSFPDKEVKVESLPGRSVAEALCRRQGVTDPVLLTGCILDVALTGQADFAAALAAGQLFTGGPDFGGIPFTIRLGKKGDVATVEFDGTAGQQVFIDVPATTMSSRCGVLDLIGPDGAKLGSGCVIGGTGHIDSTTLKATGKHKITVKAVDAAGAEARLRVITIKDQVGTLTPDAPATLVRLDKPGMVGRFTFTGRKDQKVYLDVLRSTIPSRCGVLDLFGPDGAKLRDGCIVGGSGEIDGTVLPADGTYTIVVDPNERGVGDATIRLVNAIDQRGAISLNGPTVTAKVQQPGAAAHFTFTGTAGQRIFVEVTSSTLPSQCGLLDLHDPAGAVTVSGCIVGGDGGIAETKGYVLKASGTYTIVLDPNDNATGEAVIRLRG